MAGRIIGFFCCLLCGTAFLLIVLAEKDGREPMSFWTGDESLKGKVTDVPGYNREMSRLYRQYGYAYLLIGGLWLIFPAAGVAGLFLNVSAGTYLVYRKYRRILRKYS